MEAFQIFASAVLIIFAAAIGKMWLAHLKELKDCKDDRAKLLATITDLNREVQKLTNQIGRMEGHLEAIDLRHHAAFKPGGDEKIEVKT